MATTDRRGEGEGVIFSYEEDLVTAIDVETGVAASGDSKADALAKLADALALHEGEGEPINDESAFLRDIGLNPDDSTTKMTPPWCV
jgi:predicted RNase H-like HicB family nuclease